MSDDNEDFVRHRQLRFDPHTPKEEQAAAAVDLLRALDPVVAISQQGPYSITIAYDLRSISLFEIEETLVELGFALDRSLRCKIKRSFFRYTEDIERRKLPDRPRNGLPEDTLKVFVSQYLRHRHGCRDTRPRDWREYL